MAWRLKGWSGEVMMWSITLMFVGASYAVCLMLGQKHRQRRPAMKGTHRVTRPTETRLFTVSTHERVTCDQSVRVNFADVYTSWLSLAYHLEHVDADPSPAAFIHLPTCDTLATPTKRTGRRGQCGATSREEGTVPVVLWAESWGWVACARANGRGGHRWEQG